MILLSAWSKPLKNGKPSPKNYPYWAEVVQSLTQRGYQIYQFACAGEPSVPGCAKRFDDLRIQDLELFIQNCETWLSPDNFLQHLAWTIGEPGVAIFAFSDPIIFGHPENLNLLKDRRYLREYQYRYWDDICPNPDAFVSPGVVITTALSSITQRKSRFSNDSVFGPR